MRHVFFAVFGVWAGAAMAADPVQYISSGGGLFSYTENRHGAVLTVVDLQSSTMVADPSVYSQLETGDKLYLGRACDALSRRFGEGNWVTSEGGFVISFGDDQVLFPGQSITLRTYADCTAKITE